MHFTSLIASKQNIQFDLSDYACISVKGKDAKKLLQGQLTIDIEKLTNKAEFCAHCNPQGRIISLFHIFFYEEIFYLLLPQNMVTITINALKKYAIFYKVDIAQITNELKIVGYIGDTTKINSKHLFLFSTKIPRYLLIGTPNEINNILENIVTITAQVTWKLLNMYEGISCIYPETTNKFLPHDINLPELGGVSFEKGCYTGQEIIARIHYRGKMKSQFCEVKIASIFAPIIGENIYFQEGSELKPIGAIVDWAEEAYNQYIGLIIIDGRYVNSRIQLTNTESIITIRNTSINTSEK